MMMTTRKKLNILILFLLPSVAFAQTRDFGIWYGVSAEHKLTKKLEIDLSANIRTFNNGAKIEEAFLEGGLSYNLSKHFAIAGSYRITDNIENNNFYYYQHKILLDLKGTLPAGKFSFSGRFRFQTRVKTYIKDDNDEHPDYTGRIKIKAVYKTSTFPVDPYIYAESFCPMFSANSGTIGKNRFAAGLDFKVTRHSSVELEYIFQRDYQPHLSDINIISVNYDIKF
jgi:hypothetical protein